MRIVLTLVFGFVGSLALGWSQTCNGAEEWKPLFNGKDLTGWHAVGDGKWTVEDGVIVGRADSEKLYGLLFSDEQYQDFSVRFQFKCLAGDSGFYIRTVFQQPDEAHGNQVQVGLAGSGTGGIYESYGRGWIDKPSDELQKEILKDRDWNSMTIDGQGQPHRCLREWHQDSRYQERPWPRERSFCPADALGQRDAHHVQGY